eukprot:633945-Prymnesium_polylepis.1
MNLPPPSVRVGCTQQQRAGSCPGLGSCLRTRACVGLGHFARARGSGRVEEAAVPVLWRHGTFAPTRAHALRVLG